MFDTVLLFFATLWGWSLKAHLLQQRSVFLLLPDTKQPCLGGVITAPIFPARWIYQFDNSETSSHSQQPQSREGRATRSGTFALQPWWWGCHSDKKAALSVSRSGGKRNSQGDGYNRHCNCLLSGSHFTLLCLDPRRTLHWEYSGRWGMGRLIADFRTNQSVSMRISSGISTSIYTLTGTSIRKFCCCVCHKGNMGTLRYMHTNLKVVIKMNSH